MKNIQLIQKINVYHQQQSKTFLKKNLLFISKIRHENEKRTYGWEKIFSKPLQRSKSAGSRADVKTNGIYNISNRKVLIDSSSLLELLICAGCAKSTIKCGRCQLRRYGGV